MSKSIRVGDRVETIVAKEEPMIGINVAAGQQGVVTKIEEYRCNDRYEFTIIGIKLDAFHDDLCDWDNVLEFDVDENEQSLLEYVKVVAKEEHVIDDFAATARELANDPRMAKAIAKRKAKREKLLKAMQVRS